MSLQLAIGVCVAACAACAFWGIQQTVQQIPRADRRFQDPLPLALRLIWPLISLVTLLSARWISPTRLERAYRDLRTAGADFVLLPEQLYGLRAVCALLAAAMAWLTLALLHTPALSACIEAIALATLLGGAYPSLWLHERRKRRRLRILRDLPVYLDFLVLAVEAGMNLTGAIERATEKGPPGPLGQEFSRLLRDMRSGLPRAEALQRMAERMDMTQITSFAAALTQADRVGASLGPMLRSQAMQRREERFLRAEKLALEAPVKMLLPLVMFFFPLIFLMLGYFIYLRMTQAGVF